MQSQVARPAATPRTANLTFVAESPADRHLAKCCPWMADGVFCGVPACYARTYQVIYYSAFVWCVGVAFGACSLKKAATMIARTGSARLPCLNKTKRGEALHKSFLQLKHSNYLHESSR